MVSSKVIGGRVIGGLYWRNASFFSWASEILQSEYIGMKLLACEIESALLFMLLCFTLFFSRSPGVKGWRKEPFKQKRKKLKYPMYVHGFPWYSSVVKKIYLPMQ